jgi:hypothetical protein
MKQICLYFRVKISEITKVKKGKQGSKLDYGQESEMFLKLIFTANMKDTRNLSIAIRKIL